ncbi:heparinase II/III domain-containing protein [Geminisphaera colitermitum]|uniref:heparinase II/III domain-containing protein n=1 Tax=Geminisphaera colitermitum TaxID=1148786 RepID=UPI0001964F65|nr:heparinase II/III family protein [Geminisphaera colitermitum]
MHPQNILLTTPSLDELIAIFRQHAPRSPLPPLGAPRWTAAFVQPHLVPTLVEIIRRASDPAERDAPLPPLTDALYRDFAATGTRIRFEKIYFERRRRLARAAIALLVTPDAARDPQAPLPRSFIDKLEDIFAEGSWALPAHVPDSPSGRDPHVIDLFAAETANLMAELLSVFESLIPTAQQAIIRKKLRRDIFENYLSTEFWWMRTTSNWNAVCHQGVIGAALAIEDDPGLLGALVAKAAVHLPCFIDGFGDDGACSEGPAYWDYGFGWFTLLNEQLENRTRGELSLFASHPKIPRIAAYGPAMSLSNGHAVNFADCPGVTHLRPSTLQYLGHTLGSPACQRLAIENHASLTRPETLGQLCDLSRSDFLFYSRFFLHAPPVENAKLQTQNLNPPSAPATTFLPSLGVWVVRARDTRGNTWELAAKGGNNAEHHNHNDLGSLLLHINGQPVIAEVGMPEYNASYFSPSRYTHFAARTLGHSLPLINGCEQHDGANYTAAILRADTEPAADSGLFHFEADLTAAYPAAANLRSFIRRLTFDPRAGHLRWTDTIALNAPGTVESGFITGSDALTIETPHHLILRESGRTLHFRVFSVGDDDPSKAPASTTIVMPVWIRIDSHTCSMHNGIARTWRRAILAPAQGTPPSAVFQSMVEITLQ